MLAPEDNARAERAIQANYGLGRRLYEGMGGPLGVEMVYLEVTPATATEAHDSAPSVSAGERASAEQGGAAPQ